MPSGVSVPGQAQGTNQPSPPTGVVTATNEVKLIVQANQFIPFPNFTRGSWPTFLDAHIANKAKSFIETFLTRFTGRLKTGSPPRAKFEWIFAPGGQDLEIWIPTDLITDPNPTLANHLEVRRFKIISRVRDLVLEATQGRSVFCTGGDAMGSIKLGTSTGSYAGFKGSSAGILWTLPGADGTDGQVMTTDGSGVLSFEDAGSLTYAWQVLADGGLSAQDVDDGDIVQFIGGTALTSSLGVRVGGGFEVNINHDSSGVVAGSYGTEGLDPLVTQVPVFTVDDEGHITYAADYPVATVWDLDSDDGAGSRYNIWTADGVKIAGGTAITTNSTLGNNTIEIVLDDSAVTPGTYGSATQVGQFAVDQQGRITSASNVTITGGGGSGAPVDADYVVYPSLNGTLTNERLLTGGTGIVITDGGAGGNVTITADHDEYVGWGIQADGSGTGAYVRSNEYADFTGGDVITTTLTEAGGLDGYFVTIDHDSSTVVSGSYTAADITVDSFGHVTAAANGSGGGTMSSWDLAADSGSALTVVNASSILMTGGTFIKSTNTAATCTISLSATGTPSAGSFLRGDNYWAPLTDIAMADETYVVMSASGDLHNERVLTAGTGITITDGGANSTVTIAATGGGGGSGTVTSVATSNGTFVNVSGGTITTTGTITGDLSASGTASAGSFLRGDNYWAPLTDIAMADETYVVMSSSGDLSAERVLTAGTGITITDGGANSTVTIAATGGGGGSGTVTSVATSSGTFVNITGGTITTSGTITGDLSASGTASAGSFLRGDNYWAPLTDIAKADESFVVMSASGDLSAERVLTAGTNITITDGGAGGNVTIAATGGGGGGMSEWTADPDDGDNLVVNSSSSTLYFQSSDDTVTITGDAATDTLDFKLAGSGNYLEFHSVSDDPTAYGTAVIGAGNGGLEFFTENSQSDSEEDHTLYLHFTTSTGSSIINCSLGRRVGTELAIDTTTSGGTSGDGTIPFGGMFDGVAGSITLKATDSIELTGDSGSGIIEIGHLYYGYGGTYGDADNIAQVQVDDWGHVTGIANIPKSAVVKSSDPDPDAFVELYCTESPEVRFEDVLVINPPAQCQKFTHPIDPEFLHVCETESIKAIGYTTSSPAIAGLQVHGDELRVEFSELLPVPEELVVHLSGIRTGHKGRRFEKVDSARAEANDRFWGTPFVPAKRSNQG